MEERIAVGALAGLIGGAISGLFLSRIWEDLPLAVLMGESASQANWHEHLVLALIYGMLFGGIVGKFSSTLGRSLILGPLTAIAAWYGATKIDFANALLCRLNEALIGYGLLGLITGFIFFLLLRQRLSYGQKG